MNSQNIKQKDHQDIINELLILEKEAESFRAKCYRARKKLESVHSPAPSGGKKLPQAEVIDIKSKRHKNRLRKTK